MVTCAGRSDPSLSIYCSFDNVKNNVVKGGSKYKNDGEVVGGAKFNNGKVGKAIELKQEVWVKINDAEFKNLPKDGFTLATWLITKIQEMRKVYLMLSATNMGAGLFHVEIRPAGFQFFHRNDDQAEVFNINPRPVINGKIWHYFAGTYDGKTR